MLSYILYDISYAFNMFFVLTILLQYKRSRKLLPLTFVLCFIHYLILEVICQTVNLGIDIKVSFIAAGYYELIGTFVIVGLFTSGNIWRNYAFLIFGFAVFNALSGIIISLDTQLEVLYAGYMVNEPVPVKAAIIMAVINTLSSFIVTLVMSRFIKREYKGNGRAYMIFSLSYIVIGVVQVIYKQNTIYAGMEKGNLNEIVKFIYVVIGVATFYVFGLIYFRFEGKRLGRENRELVKLVQDNHIRYQKLVEDNSRLTAVKKEFIDYSKDIEGKTNADYEAEIRSLAGEIDHIPLTGNIIIDAIISNFYTRAKGEAITYEVIPDKVELSEDKIVNCATVVENVLLVAMEFAREASKRWVYLSFRQNGELLLISAQFSKEKKGKVSSGANVFARSKDYMLRIKLIRSICESLNGTISIDNKDQEATINILINNS